MGGTHAERILTTPWVCDDRLMEIYVVSEQVEDQAQPLGAWHNYEAAQEGMRSLAMQRHPEHAQHKWGHEGDTLYAYTQGAGTAEFYISAVPLAD